MMTLPGLAARTSSMAAKLRTALRRRAQAPLDQLLLRGKNRCSQKVCNGFMLARPRVDNYGANYLLDLHDWIYMIAHMLVIGIMLIHRNCPEPELLPHHRRMPRLIWGDSTGENPM